MAGLELLVGLDVGTTSSKAVVYSLDGAALALGRAATPWSTVRGTGSSWATGTELDAHDLLNAARTAISRALAGTPEGHVVGVGVTSMAESGVLLDASGEPVAPVIAWHDTRDFDQVTRLGEEIGAETFSSRTGLPFRSQWSLTKHRWQLENDPAAARAVRRLNIAEWIVRGLGGEEASDASLASRTGWLELASRSWCPELLEWSGISPAMLPPLVTSGTTLGRVPATAGLERGTGAVLTTAGHDHQAAAVGANAAGAGDQFDSCGTAEALVRTVPAGFSRSGVSLLTESGITVGWHVLEGQWALLGATQGGLALERIASIFGGGREAVAQLDAAAMSSTAGLLTVDVDDIGGVTIGGIRDGVTAGHLWLAALEAITDRIRDVDVSMTGVVGPHHNMVAAGGWSRSQALMRVKQRTFGDVIRSDVEETGARGAALLAGLAAGLYAGPRDFPRPDPTPRPEPATAPIPVRSARPQGTLGAKLSGL
jgi:sugar (pentulose or hexulose) kinase